MDNKIYKEWWLIPKQHVVSHDSKKENEVVVEESEIGQKGSSQEGGNMLADLLEKNKVKIKRLELAKQMVQQIRPESPPTTAVAQEHHLDISKWFDPKDQFKVSYVINYIQKHLPSRLKWDQNHNLIIDGVLIDNSSIVDILRFLYDLGKHYVSQLPKFATYKNKTYGIPRGISEFIHLLTYYGKHVIDYFQFDPTRLDILHDYFFPDHKEEEEKEEWFETRDIHSPANITSAPEVGTAAGAAGAAAAPAPAPTPAPAPAPAPPSDPLLGAAAAAAASAPVKASSSSYKRKRTPGYLSTQRKKLSDYTGAVMMKKFTQRRPQTRSQSANINK